MENKTDKDIKLIEIARSFSRKLNLGNYETVDFFCSQKIEVPESEAKEASSELYEFCKQEVEDSLFIYVQEIEEKKKEKLKDTDVHF